MGSWFCLAVGGWGLRLGLDKGRHRSVIFDPTGFGAIGMATALDEKQLFGFGSGGVKLFAHCEGNLGIQFAMDNQLGDLQSADSLQGISIHQHITTNDKVGGGKDAEENGKAEFPGFHDELGVRR